MNILQQEKLQHIQQRGTVAVADGDALAGGHQDHSGADFGDFGEVDDVGAVDADETGSGEFLKESGETHQDDLRHLLAGEVDLQVLAHSLDIDYVGDLDFYNFVVGFEEHEIAGGGRSGTGGLNHLETGAQFLGGGDELAQGKRFEEIVHGIHLETFDGIFRIGGGEDHEGRTLQSLDQVHSGKVGHIYVQEHSVHLVGFQDLTSLESAGAGGRQREERHLGDVLFKLAESQRLIIHSNNP